MSVQVVEPLSDEEKSKGKKKKASVASKGETDTSRTQKYAEKPKKDDKGNDSDTDENSLEESPKEEGKSLLRTTYKDYFKGKRVMSLEEWEKAAKERKAKKIAQEEEAFLKKVIEEEKNQEIDDEFSVGSFGNIE